jgi:cell division protein FtsB
MKKQSNKNRKFLNFIYVLFILLLLSWILFWGNNSFYKKWKLKRKIDRMEQQYNTLKAQNDSLADYNYRLKTDPETAEEVAREEHGLINLMKQFYLQRSQ